MSTIAPGQGVLTFINVFTVEPDQQQSLVDLLTEAAEQTFRHLPGFVLFLAADTQIFC
jgi:Antibiotic biosynthesis monooxygenase